MSKLHWTAKDVFGLPGLPEKYKYFAIDNNGDGSFYQSEPKPFESHREWHGEGEFVLILKTDYEGDWRDSLLIRPQEIKVGDFGKGWDGMHETSDDKAVYGTIKEIDIDGGFYIFDGDDGILYYENFRKMNPPTRTE